MGASNFSDLYPPLWKKSASQFSDYRVKNGKYIIDPWVYPERMGMYKILVNKTARYFENILLDNEQNILWGLPLQNGWQYKTGRLADPRRRTDCGYDSDPLCVSVDSWWAAHLQYPSSTFEDLLKYLWAAHVATIDTVGKIFEDRLEYYSKAEANFGRNWCVAVDYLAASLFPTTLVRTHEFQEGLPPRMLVNGDRAPFISDFTEFQNTVLLLLSFLSQVDNFPGFIFTDHMGNFNEDTFCKEASSRAFSNNP
ncbi:Protein LEG1 homolog [Vulpes lagopus]